MVSSVGAERAPGKVARLASELLGSGARAYCSLLQVLGEAGRGWAWEGAGGAAHPSLCSSMLYLVLTYGMASSQPCMGLARRGSGILVTFFQYLSCGDRSMVAHDLKLGKV